MVHHAESLDETSLHCTIRFFLQKWHILFDAMNDDITTFETFREIIPIVYNRKSAKEIVSIFKKMINETIDSEKFVKAVERLITFQMIDNRENVSEKRLLSLDRIGKLSLNTLLIKQKHIKFNVKVNLKDISLSLYSKEINFPLFMKESIYFISNNDNFKVIEINGDIDNESKIIFARKLILEGILIF